MAHLVNISLYIFLNQYKYLHSFNIFLVKFNEAVNKKEDMLLNKITDNNLSNRKSKRTVKKKVFADCVSGGEFSKDSDNTNFDNKRNSKNINSKLSSPRKVFSINKTLTKAVPSDDVNISKVAQEKLKNTDAENKGKANINIYLVLY